MQIEQPDNKLNSKIVQKQAKMYQFYKDVKLKNTKNLDKILKILEKEEWTLDLGVYSNLKCKQVMEKIQVCNAEKVWLGYNTKPNILKDIINIKFNFLKQIWITHNHITSIQMLDWIHFPMLTQIWLRDNFIVKIKSLKKFKLPRLATISLYGNRITDIYCLTKALTANMTCIWVEYEDEQPVQGESLSWIAKTQTKILKSLCIGSQRRMKENKVQKIIKEKFPSLKVYKSQKNN